MLAALILSCLIALSGCQEPEQLLRAGPYESHRNYARALTLHGLDATSAGARWLEASVRPFSGSRRMLAPFIETITLDPLSTSVLAYEFPATLGQRIDLSIETDLSEFFVDLFLLEGDRSGRLVSTNPRTPDPIMSWKTGAGELSFEPGETGWYLVRIQPRLMERGQVTVSLAADAALAWPVPGTDQRRIWSYFGDSRAGGARVHHGVDIFAPRGTPLVAVSSSTVMRVGVRDLGGNIVTLHDRERELMIYYAHLDEQSAVHGSDVVAGEVIGTVGNTGNAIITPPHLHIGIYQTNWRRPVDPWYFLVPPNRSAEPVWRMEYDPGSWLLTTTSNVVPVRYPAGRSGVIQSPARFDAVGSPVSADEIAPSRLPVGPGVIPPLGTGTPVRLKGATRWYYRIELPTGEVGYVLRTDVAAADRTLLRFDTAGPMDVRLKPDTTSDVVLRYPTGSSVEVHAVFNDRFGLVFRSNGYAGWVELASEGSG